MSIGEAPGRGVMVCPTDHKHEAAGTCYVIHKCRCTPCRTENARREQWRTRQKAYGRYDNGLVDAQPVREHVQALQAAGLGYIRIARLAGVQPRAVAALLYGRQEGSSSPRKGEPVKRMKRETAVAILAVEATLDVLGEKANVPARPYMRRLHALVAVGYSISHLARRLDMEPANLHRRMRIFETAHRPGKVLMHAGTARAVVALYEELSNVHPPETEWRERISASRARRYARERGWPVPMDWEAVDNDFERIASVRRSAA